ncbi:rho GTPase-activating protein 7-like isoform X1 [Branchiostoma floridae]|uniref:Rho GTPase-activating protein 7-like isoform X1 n=1 Tax=Branchiostoma floridae TaxID=7739 RepID=A0A9J7LF94_BRAFL|nr:rho GTPase-activating protein 7-like isoform X1 [Branchiostoma floridae]
MEVDCVWPKRPDSLDLMLDLLDSELRSLPSLQSNPASASTSLNSTPSQQRHILGTQSPHDQQDSVTSSPLCSSETSPYPSPVTSPTASPDQSPELVHGSGARPKIQKVCTPREQTELEAIDACKWLRDCGFPQYAQMYEDSCFPVDITSVETDHDFLDRDSIQSLIRRLRTLNRCASMRIEAPRPQVVDDSDEDEQCAISNKWKYQRVSRRWSRLEDFSQVPEVTVDLAPVQSSDIPSQLATSYSSYDSVLTDSSDRVESHSYTSASSFDSQTGGYLRSPGIKTSRTVSSPRTKSPHPTDFPGLLPVTIEIEPKSPPPNDNGRDHRGVKGLLKRMDTLRRKRSRSSSRKRTPSKDRVVISGPVLQESTMNQAKMDRLNCVDVRKTDENSNVQGKLGEVVRRQPGQAASPHSRSRREGCVFDDDILNSLKNPTPKYSPNTYNRRNESLSRREALNRGSVVRNGCISTARGSMLNYHTGSFNLGSGTCKDVWRPVIKRQASEDSLATHSIYDNVPTSSLDTAGDIAAPQDKVAAVEEILQSISGLSEEIMSMSLSDFDEDSSHNPSSAPPTLSPLHQQVRLEIQDRPAFPDSDMGTSSSWDELEVRRGVTQKPKDSGIETTCLNKLAVGRRSRVQWHSFQKSQHPLLQVQPLEVHVLSAGQLLVLRKLSLLKLTALMERYSPSNRSGWNWAMPRFMKRIRAPEYKDKAVFGIPLLHVLQRTGQPLPQSIIYAMDYLRRTAMDQVGIFRKSGARSRIQALKRMNETNPDTLSYEGMMCYDVADMLKQYFRELPEPLLTNKLSETFVSIFTRLPTELRLQAMQAAIMLMPDENREVLQTLLLFLREVAQNVEENQMTPYNLAVCFAPSLFHIAGPRRGDHSLTRRHRSGRPNEKELSENVAAHECLNMMITECEELFQVPEDTMMQCRFTYMEQGDPVTLDQLGRKKFDESSDWHNYIENCIQGLLKESRDKFKGWVSVSCPNDVELTYKKVGDGHPLRLWKCAVEVEAPPVELLNRVLRERHLWDEDLIKWRVVEKLDRQTEVFQYVTNSMAPHPTRDYCTLRSWRTDLPHDTCVLVETSVKHPEAAIMGGLRGTVLASRYLIEPCGSGKSRLIHIVRIDTRGRSPEWYNRAYGHICAAHVGQIRDSFRHSNEGPETKV